MCERKMRLSWPAALPRSFVLRCVLSTEAFVRAGGWISQQKWGQNLNQIGTPPQ